MNRTLSITRGTDAHQVFAFLGGVNQARSSHQKQGKVVVPDPSIRVRKKGGVAEFYVSEAKKATKQTAASMLSPTKRAKRMECARIMFDVAHKFLLDHQLQDDRKAQKALADIAHFKDRTMNHDIKAGEMHALLETILKRPAEITIARQPPPLMTETGLRQQAPCAAAENPKTDKVALARKKTRRPRLKNIIRPAIAAV